jgi:regulator of replication initiation timing
MISIQLPTYPSQPFGNHYSAPYVMADPGLPSSSTGLIPTLQTAASPGNLSSGSESRAQPGAKRRPSRAGTRSVSTLTAAQLERKRANDREAQRAIRQRTKDHIASLERRIAELTATNDTGAKLMQALQRNEELEQENSILRNRLNHAVAAMSESGGTYHFSQIVAGGAASRACTSVSGKSTR